MMTIVVMLILVAVSINMLIKSNLIGTAENTVDKYKTATEEEAKDGTIEINGEKYSSVDEYIKKRLPEGAGKRADKTKEYSDGTKTAWIPEGFTVSGIESETTIDGGLVIYDIPAGTKVNWSDPDSVKTAYNQFVWIPVEVNKTTEPVDTETSISAFTRSQWQDNARGADSSKSSTIFPSSSWKSYTEPYSFSGSYSGNKDCDASTGIKTQIANLTASIYKYGGFYIGRYEAGSETERTSSSEKTTLGIKQDMYPYNFVKWGDSNTEIGETGAVYLSNNLYNKGAYGAISMLCTGACWDSMLDFIKDSDHNVTDSTTWGNYIDAEIPEINRGVYADYNSNNNTVSKFKSEISKISKTNKQSILLTTGATEKNVAKNIYDVAGNCYEWTTECSGESRVYRGRRLRNLWKFPSSKLPCCTRFSVYRKLHFLPPYTLCSTVKNA